LTENESAALDKSIVTRPSAASRSRWGKP
jgi:hypothetical protein